MSDAVQLYMKQKQYASHAIDGGIAGLVSSWEATVTEVETGYASMDLEYLNDMDGRQILSEVMPLTSESQLAQYAQRIEAADVRFFAASVPVEECIWGLRNQLKHGYSPEVHWWYFRVPKDKGPNW